MKKIILVTSIALMVSACGEPLPNNVSHETFAQWAARARAENFCRRGVQYFLITNRDGGVVAISPEYKPDGSLARCREVVMNGDKTAKGADFNIDEGQGSKPNY